MADAESQLFTLLKDEFYDVSDASRPAARCRSVTCAGLRWRVTPVSGADRARATRSALEPIP